MEKKNVGGDFGACVCLKRIVGQTDGSQEVSFLCQGFPDFAAFLVHGAFGGNKGYNAAGSHFIQCFGEKIIVDEEVLPVIAGIMDMVLPKGDIAHRQVEKIVRVVGALKAVNGNIRFLVQLSGNPAGQAVQFHAVELCVRQLCRGKPKKVSDTTGGFQHVSGCKVHLAHCVINGFDDRRAGIMGI